MVARTVVRQAAYSPDRDTASLVIPLLKVEHDARLPRCVLL
jgi:hypothetical protein